MHIFWQAAVMIFQRWKMQVKLVGMKWAAVKADQWQQSLKGFVGVGTISISLLGLCSNGGLLLLYIHFSKKP